MTIAKVIVGCAAGFCLAVGADAQATCASRRVERSGETTARGDPLGRLVTLEARDITLRDALARLAAAARVRLVYTVELLSLDRRVCLDYRASPLGVALEELLDPEVVDVIGANESLVVLAPARPFTGGSVVTTVRRAPKPMDASMLDRIVVTGSAAGAPERSQTVAVDVLRGADLQRRGATTLSEALSGVVPGIWLWAQSPSRLVARYGSIRGATSFGVSYPKIYIDGIEVANPLVLTSILPDAVERVEVIRGPQGAALYGSDAISGVVNILMRHDGMGPAGDRVQLYSGAGLSGSDFAPNGGGVLAQDHGILWRTGSGTRSVGLGLNLSSLGEFVPGEYSQRRTATADLRLMGAHTTLTMAGRLFTERAGIPDGAGSTQLRFAGLSEGRMFSGRESFQGTLPDSMPPGGHTLVTFAFDSTAPQSATHYTIGTTAALMPNARWTHTLVLGLDGYRLANVAIEGGPVPNPADSALLAARGSAERASVRLSSVARFGTDDRRAGSLTFALDHSLLREATAAAAMFYARGTGPAPLPQEVVQQHVTRRRLTGGVTTQVDLSFRNTVFLTGGLRLDRSSGFSATSQTTLLPLLGAAVVFDRGRTTLKLRSAYGKGIRPVRTTARATGWTLWGSAAQELEPETQVGFEVGADLLLGRVSTLRVTRFDQLASGLIQPVVIVAPQGGMPGHRPRPAYQLQNVGEIGNRGWELEASTTAGRLTLGTALALVDSRVERTASGYTGDLRPGDRMLEVPARTASISASWVDRDWSTGWTLTRAADWINYDRVALNDAASAPTSTPRDFTGAMLRAYWREYSGVNRLHASVARRLTHSLSFVLTGDNLLGYQEGEPDNVTLLPGRTLTAGVRVKF